MRESRYRYLMLVVLLVILAFNFVDRLALGLTMQAIKTDLHLSDTQLGLLTGFAFALFYSLMGIPIARWADRGNRVTIITLTTALWSVMVALCGAALSFGHLLLVRVGVAVGEAGAIPPAHSLIAEYFTRAERPRAMGIYMLGAPLSAFIGYFGAGWLNELYGWRMMFVMLGLPGVGLAALAWLVLREPRRSAAAKPARVAQPAQDSPGMREVFVTLWRIPSFRHMLMVFSVLFFFNTGIQQWLPAFFIRSHGLQTSQVGTWFTLAFGLSGFAGIYFGGALASRYLGNNERAQLRILAVLLVFLMLWRPVTFYMPNAMWALVLMVPAQMVFYIGEGPLFAVVQSLVPERMRAMAIAIIYLCANLIGLGFGPLAVGILSDVLRPWAGEESLRWSLIALCPGYLWVTWHLWRASLTVQQDMQAVRAASPASVAPRLGTAHEA
jgi:MFS family permease